MFEKKNSLEKSLLLLSIILSIYPLLFIGHGDLYCIAKWGYELDSHFFNGTLARFQIDMNQAIQLPSNYTLFCNTITAIWLLPIYAINTFFHLSIDASIWYKFLPFTSVMITLIFIGKICERVEVLKGKSLMIQLLYFISPLVQISTFGKGQVDGLGTMFFVIGMYYFLEKKYISMSVFLGFSILIKPFAIIFFIPVDIFLFRREKLKTLIYLAIPIIMYGFDHILSNRLITDYSYYGKQLEIYMQNLGYGSPFIMRLFEQKIFSTPIIPLCSTILCIFCGLLILQREPKPHEYLTYGTMIFVPFLLFIHFSPQWMLYILVPILFLTVARFDKIISYAFIGLFYLGYLLYGISYGGQEAIVGYNFAPIKLVDDRYYIKSSTFLDNIFQRPYDDLGLWLIFAIIFVVLYYNFRLEKTEKNFIDVDFVFHTELFEKLFLLGIFSIPVLYYLFEILSYIKAGV